MRINIIDPKAKRLLKDLEDLNLISIDRDSKSDLRVLLKKMRKHSISAPSLDDVTKEVELVRAKRYGK